jgi:hypothetical protein
VRMNRDECGGMEKGRGGMEMSGKVWRKSVER